jgi:hypothetical protein
MNRTTVALAVAAVCVSCGLAREQPHSPAAAAPQPQKVEESPRRVIHTAELWLEADAPDASREKLEAFVRANGGFLANVETHRTRRDDGGEWVDVTAVVRVPVGHFDQTLEQLRRLATHVGREQINGQDVTEEYTDLEARLRAQRALEEQYLAILKEAHNIDDVLKVQEKLGEVRTEIERAEGRRRFLEDQTSLATITAHFTRQVDSLVASGPGFGRSVIAAGHDSVEVAAAIINGAIRTMGVLAPVAVMIGLPIAALIWLVRRRRAPRPLKGSAA